MTELTVVVSDAEKERQTRVATMEFKQKIEAFGWEQIEVERRANADYEIRGSYGGGKLQRVRIVWSEEFGMPYAGPVE